MIKQLTNDDLLEEFKSQVSIQDYSRKEPIEGVKIIDIPMHRGEEGYFAELMRVDENGCVASFPDFKLAQINRVKLYPGTIKAWHLHLRQDEFWCVSADSHLLVGLWDLRKDSTTSKTSMKMVLGEGKTQLLYIPSGVAHGLSVISSQKVEMLYFVNQTFSLDNPDEQRVNWDSLGADFWQPGKN